MSERIHPESLRTLRQLMKLHGAARLCRAIKEIEQEEKLLAAVKTVAAKLED